jgi:ElaB/YqjD/DUF883 family membrane-anchored ribosome-binding protein
MSDIDERLEFGRPLTLKEYQMETTPQQFNPLLQSPTRDAGTADGIAAKVGNLAQSVKQQAGEKASETMDQAKRKVEELYDSANKTLNQQYDRAVSYTRENPGTTTLIAFGAGVGVGMLLLSNLSGSRSRRGRVIEPVMNAVSTLASELFR